MFLIISLFVCTPGSVLSAEKRITIDVIRPITGPISLWGIGCIRGYEMYFDKVNEESGVNIENARYSIDFRCNVHLKG